MLWKHYKSNIKDIIALAYPVILSQLGHILVGIVDIAIVGKIGTVEQAAVSLANSFHLLFLVFGVGISIGVTPLVAAADATSDTTKNASLLKHSVLINTLVGSTLFLMLFFLSPALTLLNQSAQVVEIAIPFLNVLSLGLIPLCFFSGLKQFAEGLSFTRMAMFVTIVSNIVNIALNYIMVFGYFGFPEMGVMGSCWASFFSRLLMALLMFIYIYKNSAFSKYWKLYTSSIISKELIKKVLTLGIPSGLQWVFEIGAFSFAVVMIGWISPQAQAAHQIAISFAALTYMVASGLAAATSVKVGNGYGLMDKGKVRSAAFSSFFLILFIMIFSASSFIVFKEKLPLLFNANAEVVQIASSLLFITAFFQFSDGVQTVMLGALRGLQDVKVPTFIALFAYWGAGLPVSYFFGFVLNYGVQGIWYGLSMGLTVAAVLLFWRFNVVSNKIK